MGINYNQLFENKKYQSSGKDKKMEEIEKYPLIQLFDVWVQKLPAEHRSKAYEYAKDFLDIGLLCGSLRAALECESILSKKPRKKSELDTQEEYRDYLQKKMEEYESLSTVNKI